MGNRDVFERWLEAVNSHDLDALDSLTHPEFEDFYPQSGEVIRGVPNLMAIIRNYPGGPPGLDRDRVIGGEERWVRTQMFTMIRIEGTGDVLTGIQRVQYPDGAVWFLIVIGEMRDGLVYRTQSFFAPTFEPADWRRQWVELRARPDAG